MGGVSGELEGRLPWWLWQNPQGEGGQGHHPWLFRRKNSLCMENTV